VFVLVARLTVPCAWLSGSEIMRQTGMAWLGAPSVLVSRRAHGCVSGRSLEEPDNSGLAPHPGLGRRTGGPGGVLFPNHPYGREYRRGVN